MGPRGNFTPCPPSRRPCSDGTIEPSNSASTASVIGTTTSRKNRVIVVFKNTSKETEGPPFTSAVGELSDSRTSKEIYVLDV